MGAETQNGDEQRDSDVIRDALAAEEFVYFDDEVTYTGFDDESGAAEATVRFDSCLSSGQLDMIRESNVWELTGVHPGAGDAVTGHLTGSL